MEWVCIHVAVLDPSANILLGMRVTTMKGHNVLITDKKRSRRNVRMNKCVEFNALDKNIHRKNLVLGHLFVYFSEAAILRQICIINSPGN